MAHRLKRWETPRKGGRNDKGRGGSARRRQKAKQLKSLRTKLKANGVSDPPPHFKGSDNEYDLREKCQSSPVLFLM